MGSKVLFSWDEEGRSKGVDGDEGRETDELEDGNLHHGLVEVGRFVLDNLDGDDFMCSDVLAFDDLTKGALAENVEDEIPRGKSEGFQAKEGEREDLWASSEPRQSLT